MVISWGKSKGGGSWRLHRFLCEIKDHVKELHVDVVHIAREFNSLANRVAKWSLSQDSVFVGNYLSDW